MANLLRQDILAKAPIPQNESPLYAKLPGEVRDSIFSYVLTDHPDPTPDKRFKENTCYTRPSYLAAQSTDTRLLRTCRAIYRETWFKPFLLREHTEWATGEDRAPPPHKAPPRLRPMLAKISKSLGTDKVEIERLRVFAQMYRLQENGLREVLRTPHLAPRTITLTIRHTDWWYWEEDEPLHFDGNWIEGVCQVLAPSTTQFCIELESLERKKDQVDKIAKQMVDSWFFKRPDGVVLYADTSDSNRKVSRWSGSSTWHGQRWIRDETEPHKLDYYVVSITFRPLISIERSGGSASEKAIKEAQDPQAPERPKLSLPDNEKRIETENPYDDGYNGLPQPESDNDEWYAEMEEIYGNGRFMQGLFDNTFSYPPYAILSHCWYSSELELTFKDFENLSQHTSKPGYSKIISACRAAITQGYDWLWADTVCINAEDKLEKEETVKNLHSMFLNAGGKSSPGDSGYDDVKRGSGDPQANSLRGAARILKKRVTTPLPPSSVPATVSFETYGEYQVICESQKQRDLTDLTSKVLRVTKVYENDTALMFSVAFPYGSVHWPQMSLLDLASHNSLGEPVAQDYLFGSQTIELTTSGRIDDQQAMHQPSNVWLRPIREGGPSDSYPLEPTPINTQSPHEYGSVRSEGITNSPCSSTFDLTVQSHGTRPSTVPPSLPHKPQNPKGALDSLQATECQAEEEESISSSHHREGQNQWSPGKSENNRAECDTATTYSFNTLSDDPKFVYFQAFIDQLADDLRAASDGTILQKLGQRFLDQTLRDFAWKLHEESTNPFQLEISVIIHRRRRNVIDLLDFQVPALEEAESVSDQSLGDSQAKNGEETSTAPFKKAEEMIVDWIDDVKSGEPNDLSQMPQYRQFIQGSEAYQWLLTKISQQSRLSCEEPSLMNEIGNTIRNNLKETIPHHRMSRKKASIGFEMTYFLALDVIGIMKRSGISSSFGKALPNILCFTGKWDEAQATSVAEYMDQTWPQSGGAIISLLQDLLSEQERAYSQFVGESIKTRRSGPWAKAVWPKTTRGNYSNHCTLTGFMRQIRDTNFRYQISAKGGYYAVSEVGEQLALLASVFREHSRVGGFISIMPHVDNFSTKPYKNSSGSITSVMGECTFSFSIFSETPYKPNQGFCWERLFSSLNIVRGYPILRRSVPNPGLEVSLRYAASIVGSSEVVQWGSRLVIKGFNMMMIATQATADVVVWHLLVSRKPEERISYVDPRLDHIDIKSSEEISLRHIEGKSHIIGWCTKATDLCGNPTTNHEIKPGGLPKSSASIVVDKLYIEGGSPVTAGVMLDVNKKEQPFWLQREKDYPSLLNWVKLQPVIFYDVEERRAWLVDGASALLHLVRISLHLDINDPESAYDWIYDPSKLKDHWPGVGSRQAALQTLKNWENRALNVYIVDKHMDSNGVPVTKYSTFEERVKRILHSLEKLIDRQAQAASQDGIKISQTLDPRRDVVGFDIVDVIDPAVPIYPRIQHLNSWGHGWIDLIPTVGITALFGRGFGDLIRADEPDLICPSWRSVPVGKDYLAASISTMRMLHEKRLLRMEPGLVGGELTKKITWVAAKEASLYCKCLKRQGSSIVQTAESVCNHNPVQFLAKKWWSRTIPHGLKPVHLGSLDAEGAVIFGHTVLGLRTGDRSMSRHADDDGDASMTSSEQTQDASATGSIVSQTTSITVPSVGHSSQDVGSAQESLDGTSNATGEGKKKRWSKFRNWVKK
ncbi:hypothetical protein FCOIX_5357 [Fusarium coicis]|nr:hypothetical protein FCOIX_5357 [Fusarium coicis]